MRGAGHQLTKTQTTSTYITPDKHQIPCQKKEIKFQSAVLTFFHIKKPRFQKIEVLPEPKRTFRHSYQSLGCGKIFMKGT